MITCNHDNKKGCKKHKTCNLKTPMTQYTLTINHYLQQLQAARERITEYHQLQQDIQNHKHSIPINVYGHINYAPKQNSFGVFIKRPEHLYYGWNLNKLNNEINELTSKIRELRLKEMKQ